MRRRYKYFIAILSGLVAGLAIAAALSSLYSKSSLNESCMSCHVHTDADNSWKQSYHVLNSSGMTTDCAACHLPPADGTPKRFLAKTATGIKDIWSYLFKDSKKIDWDRKGELEYASGIVYNESCKSCHKHLYPEGISDDGITAHLYYEENEKEFDLQCISCHLDAGHFNPSYSHAKLVGVPTDSNTETDTFTSPAEITGFSDFTETVPGTKSSIRMIAVPGGKFTIGSPDGEAFRNPDEGPRKEVGVSSFFMSESEINWDQFWAFYGETMSEGRTPPETVYANNSRPDLDAVSGPTPPFGDPSQGWGYGERPAITMTWYAAATYCQWLSIKTGRKYRLPTEAEWEYAARAGSDDAYFFGGNPKKYSAEGLWNSIFGADTTCINSYAVYGLNSRNRTQTPDKVRANAFGLKNMLGNVMEFCSDWYSADTYAQIQDGAQDPRGPETGEEHVVRGGMYSDDASRLRCAARMSTRTKEWLRTDPQKPKSIWWYSDIKGIGFRIVCEIPEEIKQ